MPSHPTSRRFTLVSSSHLRLGLPSGLFPSGFPTKTPYTLLPHSATCPVQLIRLQNYTNKFIKLSTILRGFLFLLGFLTLEDGTGRLSRIVGKELPLLAV